jgi:ABC-type nitrate/sulfonate/bicarbonate transport system substrate-binding protein
VVQGCSTTGDKPRFKENAMRTLSRIAITVVLLTALAAVPPRVWSQTAPTYTFAAVNNMNHLPEFVGVEKGIFLKHGIDLKLKVLKSGAEAMRAFQAGDAQFETVSPTIMAAAYNNGIKLTAIASIMGDASIVNYDETFAITARDGTGIRPGHVEDLIGKRVGTLLAGNPEIYLRAVLAKMKIPVDRVTFVNVPAPDTPSVMRSGSIDAAVTWEPYGVMILDQVPKSYLVQRGGGYVGYALWVGTSPEFLKANSDLAQRLVDAFAESSWWIRHNRHEAAVVATHWIEGLDVASAEKAIAYMRFDPRFSRDTIKAAEAEQQIDLDQGRIKQTIDFSSGYLLTSYLAKTEKESPRFFSDLKPAN